MSEVEDYLRKHKIFGRLKPYNPIDERDCDSHSFLSYQDALEAVRIAREEHKQEMEEEIIKGRKKMLEHIKNFVEINIKARDEELTRLCKKSSVGVGARGKE